MKKLLFVSIACMMLGSITACEKKDDNNTEISEIVSDIESSEKIEATQVEQTTTEESSEVEASNPEEIASTTEQAESNLEETENNTTMTDNANMDADAYVGVYNDYDVNEPNLWITLNEDGSYSVIIGIFRLASFDDGVGTLTEDGLEFSATDPAGNPIGGVITLEGNDAVVTFTDSTWEYIYNGRSFSYARSSTEN